MSNRHARLRHNTTNIALGAGNALLTGALFAGTTLWVTTRASESGFGLLNLTSWPIWVNSVAAVLLIDAWQYLWHRVNHVIPLLWRFHSVHHTDRELDASTAVRFHTGEILAAAVFRLAVWPLLGVSVGQVLLYEMLVMPVILFHHSNIRFPMAVDRVLRALIVTPGIHRVHHSVERREHDANYASIFSFWDRMFGSYRGARADVVVGLKGIEDPRWRTLSGMLRSPFQSINRD